MNLLPTHLHRARLRGLPLFVGVALSSAVALVSSEVLARDEAAPGSTSTRGVDPQAQTLHELAQVDARNKDFAKAREKILQALSFDAPPLDAYYALGQVEMALALPCAAVESYRRYLELGQGRISENRRAQVEHHIRLIVANVGDSCEPEPTQAELIVSCPHENVKAVLDGRVISTSSEPKILAPGRHEVVFLVGKRKGTPSYIDLTAGSTGRVDCVALPASLPENRADSAGPKGWNTGQKVSFGIASVGLSLGIASLSMYAWNLGRYQVWKNSDEYSRVTDGGESPTDEFLDTKDSIDRVGRINVGLAIGAAVVTGVGVTWFVLQSRKRARTRGASSSLSAHVGLESATLAWKTSF